MTSEYACSAYGEDNKDDDRDNKDDVIVGVLFHRSVRSNYSSLSVALITEENGRVPGGQVDVDDDPVVIRLQFEGCVTDLRSYSRRTFKLGDKLRIKGGSSEVIAEHLETEWNRNRLVLRVESAEHAKKHIQIEKVNFWSPFQCQAWQKRFYVDGDNNKKQNQSAGEQNPNHSSSTCGRQTARSQGHSGGGLGKRKQAEYLASFLIDAVMKSLAHEHKKLNNAVDMPGSKVASESDLKLQAIAFLNAGSGVIDAAGGSGHVSMALGLAGVKSTVVDPRPTVGKLPGRDRKIWTRALAGAKTSTSTSTGNPLVGSTTELYCQEIVPFQTKRAWFGSPPDEVERSFRLPDKQEVPVCDESSDFLRQASAIIALHPDEATGSIVEVAVKNAIPFVVVPCCVFCRLFPDRKRPGTNDTVSTYEHLLEYLCSKHQSIQKATMPCEGKNTILWSTFEV